MRQVSARIIDMAAWQAKHEQAIIRSLYAGQVPVKRPTVDQLLGFMPQPTSGGAA